MEPFIVEVSRATNVLAADLGIRAILPLIIGGVATILFFGISAYVMLTSQSRVARRTAVLLGNLDAVTARLNEGEKLGKFGTFALNFRHPEMSFWSEYMYELCGLVKRRNIPSIETVLDSVFDEDKPLARLGWESAQKQPGAFSFTYRARGLGNELRTLRVEGTTTFDSEMRPYSTSGVVRDVTKEVEVDKAKSEFVSLASHQLKTPLTTVRWHTEALLATIGLSEKQKVHAKTIAEANQRMISLVNELLSVSRIELNTFSQKPEEIDVKVLVESVVEEQRPISESREQKLTVIIADVPHIVADKTMARMVFQNLLSNAIKYTPNGGQVSCEVGLGGAKKEGIFVRVSDTGIGIPKKEQGRVFEKLHRASNARAQVADGTGLGLYAVKMILDHAGGGISFDSSEGKGSTFYVTFPFDWRSEKGTGPRGGA